MSAGARDAPSPAADLNIAAPDGVSISAATLVSHAPQSPHDHAAGRADGGAPSADTHYGPACPTCSKLNHPGTIRCVFCGHTFGSASSAPPSDDKSNVHPSSPPVSAVNWPTVEPPASVRSVRIELPADAPASTGPASSTASSALRRSNWSNSFDEIHMPVADPLIGVVVADRYRIVEGLGRGGMGIVYKVEHKQIGKLLAMKPLTGELSRNPEVVRRFKHEALTASRLSNPNTVQVFDFGVSDGLTYLVMELVAGEDLGRLLRVHGPMPWMRLGKVIAQVCSSLAEAHGKGIVHRDIKPENVMLVRARDGSDIAKVLDFGLAKLREGEGLSELTSAGAIVGTPYFMSPEQVRGDPVDARSDIYSLGALMYRALTGHYPFNGPTPMSVFTKHLTEMPPAPIDRAPDLGIPLGVSRLVMKALLKNPADRFQRVEDLQTAVVEQLRALGTSSVETLLDSGAVRNLEKAEVRAGAGAEIATRDEVERYERKLRRQRYTALAFIIVMLVGAVGGAAKFYWSRKPVFTGVETEPNDVAGDANPVPFGRTVSGYLGRRLDMNRGDRDFFAVDIPPPEGGGSIATARLRVTALPNIPMCTLIYRPGLSQALGQYCVGRPGRDLQIPALRLEAGRYFVAVLQDMDSYGTPSQAYVYENVSDVYSIVVDTAERPVGIETEPNDQVASALSIAAGESVSGVLGWARDEDVICVRAGAGERVRFQVTDAARDIGTVLEATPLRGTEEGAPLRIHLTGKHKPTTSDVMNPWTSEPVQVELETPRCVRLRLTLDPWDPGRGVMFPAGGPEMYKVEVIAVD
ncbi:MAG: protein kinase [Polyangiaceae bacterium]|nr:protein kinase [Polyangiaceae bacterium]